MNKLDMYLIRAAKSNNPVRVFNWIYRKFFFDSDNDQEYVLTVICHHLWEIIDECNLATKSKIIDKLLQNDPFYNEECLFQNKINGHMYRTAKNIIHYSVKNQFPENMVWGARWRK